MKIYFDNNATTMVAPEVREAMQPFLAEAFGNPSSGHRVGERAAAAVDMARQQVAELLCCHPDRLVFTGGGTEANNQAIWSAISGSPARKHIITSNVEHASVLKPLEYLAAALDYDVELLAVDDSGGLSIARLAAAIRPDTALVSLMAANNETGVVWPVQEFAVLCRERGVLFHCDAVQMAGKEPIDLSAWPVDYLAIAGHKLHGPKGVGALYVSRTAPCTPLIRGAGQEKGRRAGTENVPGLVGFGKACELAGQEPAAYRLKVGILRDRLEAGIRSRIPGLIINCGEQPRLANTSNLSFANCSSTALIQELDDRGIAVSAHSACHSGDLDPSHVLRALHIPESFLHGTLRISLSRLNTVAEVDALLEILPGIVAKSRQGFAG